MLMNPGEPVTQRRVIAALSVCCAVLLIVTIWALANRNQYTAEGPVYWVALDGDDAAPGTSSGPVAALQKAADTAPPGAQVLVREGVYAQRVELHVLGEPEGVRWIHRVRTRTGCDRGARGRFYDGGALGPPPP